MHLQLQQPEGDLFPCGCDTTDGSQTSSNDTPAPERAVCQHCKPLPSNEEERVASLEQNVEEGPPPEDDSSAEVVASEGMDQKEILQEDEENKYGEQHIEKEVYEDIEEEITVTEAVEERKTPVEEELEAQQDIFQVATENESQDTESAADENNVRQSEVESAEEAETVPEPEERDLDLTESQDLPDVSDPAEEPEVTEQPEVEAMHEVVSEPELNTEPDPELETLHQVNQEPSLEVAVDGAMKETTEDTPVSEQGSNEEVPAEDPSPSQSKGTKRCLNADVLFISKDEMI